MAMTYLQLVQKAVSEAGITQTTPEPQTLSNLTGLALKFKNWVADAWDEIKIENDQAEYTKAWFYTTVNPRFYFDLNAVGLSQCFAGDTLVGLYSGCTFLVTNVIIVNNGLWADGSAQGFVEFTTLTGSPFDSEPLKIKATGLTSCRFIKWGDYRLDNQTEMGTAYVQNLQDVWWQSLRISDVPSGTARITEVALPYLDYSAFLQRFDTGVQSLGTPQIATETPDDGSRLMFWPPPDRPYRIGGYYYKNIDALVNDNDTPVGLKDFYHPMIAWRAILYYGQYEGGDQAIISQAKSRYVLYKKKMDRESTLPPVLRPIKLY